MSKNSRRIRETRLLLIHLHLLHLSCLGLQHPWDFAPMISSLLIAPEKKKRRFFFYIRVLLLYYVHAVHASSACLRWWFSTLVNFQNV